MKTLTENLSIMEQNQTHDMPDFLKSMTRKWSYICKKGVKKEG